MKALWLFGVLVSFGWFAVAARTDEDHWHPAGQRLAHAEPQAPAPIPWDSSAVSLDRPLPAGEASPSPNANSGSSGLGVSLGRPIAGTDPTVTGSGYVDPHLSQAAYGSSAASQESQARVQAAEVAAPLPTGPPMPGATESPAAVQVESTGTFATGTTTSTFKGTSSFASDHEGGAPLEVAPSPSPVAVTVADTCCNDCSTGVCGTGCCSPCGTCCSGFENMDDGPSRFYISGEYLLWWIKPSTLPPLVTTGPAGAGVTGILGVPGTAVLFGGNDIDNGARSGARITAGGWFDECQNTGLEGNYFFLGQRANRFNADSSAFPVLARPFFNVTTGTEFAEVTANPAISTGKIEIIAPSTLWGAELDLRQHLYCGELCRVDLLAGFRYLDLTEGLTIKETINHLPAAMVFPGANIIVIDDFHTRNQFYGGQLGTKVQFHKNRWNLDVLAKLAMGETHQSIDIQGYQVVTTPAGATTVFNGGLLALPSNSGHSSRDVFSVVPEVGLNIGYQATDHIKLFVGYSFLYWSDVVRPGDQVDRAINVTQVPNNGLGLPPGGLVRPVVPFNGTDFWAHGVNFGVEFRF